MLQVRFALAQTNTFNQGIDQLLSDQVCYRNCDNRKRNETNLSKDLFFVDTNQASGDIF